jgi:hypothetical protein
MSLPVNNRAQQRARVSLFFGFIWLIAGLIWLILVINYGSLVGMISDPLSPAGVFMENRIHAIERTGYFLWVGSGLLCIITAFPEPKNPRSWQGATAVFLAILVILIVLIPALCRMIGFS